MMRVKKFKPVFVEQAPTHLESGMLYVSLKYHTVLHLCACGCGEEVVTPLAPNEWKMLFDGVSISLYPSIGNFRFPCRSHYYIRNNRVLWLPKCEEEQYRGKMKKWLKKWRWKG